jgi:hypothetical protein
MRIDGGHLKHLFLTKIKYPIHIYHIEHELSRQRSLKYPSLLPSIGNQMDINALPDKLSYDRQPLILLSAASALPPADFP